MQNQIKKGRSGTRELLKSFNNKNSIALMIDQRVVKEKNQIFLDKMLLQQLYQLNL